MSNLEWKGRWNEIKGRIKSSYGDITEDDLQFEEGLEEQLFGRLQKKTGKTKEQVQQWLNDL